METKITFTQQLINTVKQFNDVKLINRPSKFSYCF